MSVLSSLTNRIFLVVRAAGAWCRLAWPSIASTIGHRAGRDRPAAPASPKRRRSSSEYSRTQFADFVVKGTLIADLPILKGAAATDDPPTVEPIARDYQRQVGADLFVVIGRTDRVLARAGRVQPDERDISAILAACRRSADGTTFWPYADGVLHAVAIPMEPGRRRSARSSSASASTRTRRSASRR